MLRYFVEYSVICVYVIIKYITCTLYSTYFLLDAASGMAAWIVRQEIFFIIIHN